MAAISPIRPSVSPALTPAGKTPAPIPPARNETRFIPALQRTGRTILAATALASSGCDAESASLSAGIAIGTLGLLHFWERIVSPFLPNLSPFSTDNLPRTVDNGPMGEFFRQSIEGFNVYSPLVYPEGVKEQGLIILISGGFTDYTCFGELPLALAGQGWHVKVLVYPGFEKIPDCPSLEGGYHRALKVSEFWISSLKKTVSFLIQNEKDRKAPVFLGGHSLGGAGSLIAYESLALDEQLRVKGLLLGAPAITMKAMDKRQPKGWLLRKIGLPLLAALRVRQKRVPPKIDENLTKFVRSQLSRPMGANLAAIRLGEEAGRVLKRLAQRDQLPKVLLVDADTSDMTVSPRSAKAIRATFPEAETIRHDGGHWVFLDPYREILFRKIADVMQKTITSNGHQP